MTNYKEFLLSIVLHLLMFGIYSMSAILVNDLDINYKLRFYVLTSAIFSSLYFYNISKKMASFFTRKQKENEVKADE